jgi:hypothetical protein
MTAAERDFVRIGFDERKERKRAKIEANVGPKDLTKARGGEVGERRVEGRRKARFEESWRGRNEVVGGCGMGGGGDSKTGSAQLAVEDRFGSNSLRCCSNTESNNRERPE